jgi:RNA polymerase sigma-70 factor (ECF subfamily)
LCATLLNKSYPRLTRPPTNLETDELLGGVVAGLLTALRTTRPPIVCRFFALANQHIRWQLDDLDGTVYILRLSALAPRKQP